MSPPRGASYRFSQRSLVFSTTPRVLKIEPNVLFSEGSLDQIFPRTPCYWQNLPGLKKSSAEKRSHPYVDSTLYAVKKKRKDKNRTTTTLLDTLEYKLQ